MVANSTSVNWPTPECGRTGWNVSAFTMLTNRWDEQPKDEMKRRRRRMESERSSGGVER